MNRNKIYYTILSLTFLLIIIVIGFLNVRNSEHILASEKRMAAPFPSMKFNSIDSFPRNFENYYNDRLLFRNELIQIYRDFKFYYLNINPSPELIIMGKNDWLYERSLVLQDTIDFDVLKKELILRSEWCKEREIELVIIVIPSKAKVYSEFLPDDYKSIVQEDIDRLNQFVKHINELDIKMIYPLSVLKENKTKGKVFYKGDTHWTSKGAYIGYLEIVDKLLLKGLRPEKDLAFYPQNDKELNLINLLGVSNYNNEPEDIIIYMPLNKDVIAYSLKTEDIQSRRNDITSIESDSVCFPKAMIIRDSFTTALEHFLVNNFSTTTFVWDGWKYAFNKKLILEHQPDMLFYIMHDSGLKVMIDNSMVKID